MVGPAARSYSCDIGRRRWDMPGACPQPTDTMPTLSFLDAALFLLESPDRHFNVGPLIVLDPPKRAAREICRQAPRAHAQASGRGAVHLPVVQIDARHAFARGGSRLRPGPARAPRDPAGAGQPEAAARPGRRVASEDARPRPPLVGALCDRRLGRRQGRVVRQDASRRDRWAHLREGGLQLARAVAERPRRACHVGRPARSARASARPAPRAPTPLRSGLDKAVGVASMVTSLYRMLVGQWRVALPEKATR